MAARPSKRARRSPAGTTLNGRLRSPRRKPTELHLRRTPMQARGQATFERILDATAQLLEKVGTDTLTTNLIARAATVNVATLYQYFPNKQAVLLALFQRQSEARIELGERLLGGFADAPDWLEYGIPRLKMQEHIDQRLKAREKDKATAAGSGGGR